MIIGVHHTQITIPVGAEEKARAFYCDLLGLKEVPKPEALKGRGGFWIQLSNAQVHVGGEDGFDRTKTKAHVAYAVDDLSKVRELIINHGIEPKDGIPLPGYDRFECRDPFGNRMEFIQRLGI
jgi:catechol 2,3-dioxygenase-like lactoylglutathione lyase family enzyme